MLIQNIKKILESSECTLIRMNALSSIYIHITYYLSQLYMYNAHAQKSPDYTHNRIINDHEEHMKEMLTGGLEWFCEEKRGRGPFVLKLEGR